MTFADARPRGDAALVEATRDGDHAAFSELFERHRPAVERLAQILAAEPDTLVSATFIEALGRALDGEAAGVAARPWLLQVVLDCHGTPAPPSATATAFWSVSGDVQAALWRGVVEDDGSRLSAAVADELRHAFLRQHRAEPLPPHPRTHLDDLAARADSCATCLGLWWTLDDLTSAPTLARALLGPAGERYLRQVPPEPRALRPRSRWLPAAAVAFVAATLLTTSLGALAVAQWGPGSVPPAWRTLDPVPRPAGSAPPPTPAPTPSSTPDASPPTSTPPEPSIPGTAAPSSAPPKTPSAPPVGGSRPPAVMRVDFAFADPQDETIVRDGASYEARRMHFRLLAAQAGGDHARTVTVRFDFVGPITYLGSEAVSCTATTGSVTCTAKLVPGQVLDAAILVEDDRGEGTAAVSSSDDPATVRQHAFAYGAWTAPESAREPEPAESAPTTAAP